MDKTLSLFKHSCQSREHEQASLFIHSCDRVVKVVVDGDQLHLFPLSRLDSPHSKTSTKKHPTIDDMMQRRYFSSLVSGGKKLWWGQVFLHCFLWADPISATPWKTNFGHLCSILSQKLALEHFVGQPGGVALPNYVEKLIRFNRFRPFRRDVSVLFLH